MNSDEAYLTISANSFFRMREVLLENLFSGFTAALASISMIAGTVTFTEFLLLPAMGGGTPFTYEIALLVGLFCCILLVPLFYFLPFLLGVNFYIKRLVFANCEVGMPGDFFFVCQISFEPRRYGGIRGFLEDADDIGLLKFETSRLLYEGDGLTFCVPYDHVEIIRELSSGWIGVGILGKRVKVRLRLPDSEQVLIIGERHSRTLPESRKIARKIIEQLRMRIEHYTEALPITGNP